MTTRITLAEFERELASFGSSVPDGAAYERLGTLTIDHPLTLALQQTDPFSDRYRRLALELYQSLSCRTDDYDAGRDEQAQIAAVNLSMDLPPWSFRRPSLVAEFFASWFQIFRLLDLPDGGRVLECGFGTGQLLLFLARAGVEAYGTDINAQAVTITQRQADVLGLPIRLEVACFGEGFAGTLFDRIIFFEAFHHAWNFETLLTRLRDRLTPGGRIILCGEPIVAAPTPSIPYSWGPRLDALSIFCMRRWGWMELGFQESFFIEATRRAGWKTAFHPMAECGRAAAYVMTPVRQDARLDTASETIWQSRGRVAGLQSFPGKLARWARAAVMMPHRVTEMSRRLQTLETQISERRNSDSDE